jgi:hexosaminidase
MAWYGIVFSAAAAWQPGTVDVASFDRSFDWTFYRSTGDAFVQSIRKLDQIHNLFRSAGVGDANDEMFWFDPFSETGAERVRKASGVAAQVRRLAEDAWVDLAAHSGEALVHRDTLPFLRFAAKRLDCVGMKLQYSREIANSYREHKTYAAGQRVQDLRDYVNELKGAYRALWLSENRPYWIDNVLVRYDNEALYWVQKARLFSSAERRNRREGTVPSPESLGLVLP